MARFRIYLQYPLGSTGRKVIEVSGADAARLMDADPNEIVRVGALRLNMAHVISIEPVTEPVPKE